ncbi:MAG: 6-phosphogluconolactonase [Candidatus Woesearchaeota archaeon]|nr:6-phosphogluconolactonase [Candidatus Woesearchaeota archaeon]
MPSSKLLVARDYNQLSEIAAERVLAAVERKPASNLLVPTGTSPIGMYEILSQYGEAFGTATFFNLDDFCERVDGAWQLVPETNPVSYRRFMQEHFFSSLDDPEFYFPGTENKEHPGTYDRQIEEAGGIDLAILGVGPDGHYAFVFPEMPFDSVTQFTAMNDITRDVNAELSGHPTPEYAITVGHQTISDARSILMLIPGERKADIAARVLTESISPALPATNLRNYPEKVTYILDAAAASKLPKAMIASGQV